MFQVCVSLWPSCMHLECCLFACLLACFVCLGKKSFKKLTCSYSISLLMLDWFDTAVLIETDPS